MKNLLPEKLTALRKNLQLSQGDLAQRLDVPVSEYMNWENGNTICTIAQLKEMADIFGVSVQDLADNTKTLTLPRTDTDQDSVQIPFMNTINGFHTDENTDTDTVQSTESTQETATIMPMDGSEDQENTQTQNHLEETRVMQTGDFEKTTVNRIVDNDEEEEQEEEKPEPKKPAGKKPAGKKKLSRNGIIIIAVCAALVIGLIVYFVSRNNNNKDTDSVSLSSTNRLALAEKFTLYLNDSSELVTYGTNLPSLTDFTDLAQISARGTFALGLKKDGTAVCSGAGTACEVTDWNHLTMIAAGDNHSVGLKEDGTVVCAGSEDACDVSDWKDIKAVYAGNEITIGLTSDGKLMTSGNFSVSSKLESLSSIQDVSVGDTEIGVVTTDGKVNMYALGTGSTLDTSTWTGMSRVVTGDSFAAAMTSGGKVSIATSDTALKSAVEAWANVKYLAARNSTIVAIGTDGKMYGAGDNTYNQYEDTAATATPTASASASASAAAKLTTPNNPQFTVTSANLTISWDAVTDASYYTVTVDTSPATSIKSAKNSASVEIGKLTDGHTYTVTITAHAKDETATSASDTRTVTYTYKTPTTTLDTPGSVSFTAGSSGLTITWGAVSHADYYQVSINTSPVLTVNSNTTSTTFATSSLKSGTTYTVTITACSNDSKYAASSAFNGTIQYNAPTSTPTATPNCGTHGSFSTDKNACVCTDGYTGTSCDTAPADADAIVQFTSGDLDLSALTYKEAVKYGGTLTVKIPDGYKVVDGEKTSYTYDELKANGTVTVKVTQNQ